MIRKIAAFEPIPSRRTWGEAWWTSRDICAANEPEWAMPDFAGAYLAELEHEFWRGAHA